MVKAVETNLEGILEGKKQYQVPLFQRTYSWDKPQLDQLWRDVSQLAEDQSDRPETTHFLGSMVLAPSPSNGPTGLSMFLVIDGQQRLTTLTLLLAAIRDHRELTEHPDHRARINEQYLVNKWEPGEPAKVVPTQADRDSYLACIRGTAHAGGADPVGTAYSFFRARLLEFDDVEDPLDVARLENAVVKGLALVSVTAQHGDNVHRIFESLNNRGRQLTQADLLRNYLFMRLPTRADVVYHSVWLPLQERLTSEELELLFWLDLVREDELVKQSDVYARQQSRLDRITAEEDIEAELHRFAGLGELLYLALNPAGESDPAVRERLEHINAWGTSTVLPVVVHLLDRRAHGEITSTAVADALLYLESFLVRRVVFGRATNNINRILLRAVPVLATATHVDSALRTYLSTGRKFWATDEEVRRSVSTINFYWSGRAPQKKLILAWLEQSWGSKEPVDTAKLTIEHVAPQSPTDAWRKDWEAELGPDNDFDSVYSSLLHTLGNLTLTGYNSELSNSAFEVKRAALQSSALKMNQAIAHNDSWGPEQIRARASDLAERLIARWPGPDPNAVEELENPVWLRMEQALAAIPAGAWTSYLDVAALIGTHQVPLGVRLGNHPTVNAYRVLRADGTLSPDFRWTDPDRHDDPRSVLESEGVDFDEKGRALANQRLSTQDLAHLLGWDDTDVVGAIAEPDPGTTPELRDRFLSQLAEQQSASTTDGVLRLLQAWTVAGGKLHYGSSDETSCFLMARTPDDPLGSIWPFTIYPSGRIEVVFQYLATRPPFDDLGMRRELMSRLNQTPGLDLPAAKIALRPSFPAAVLTIEPHRATLVETLQWFIARVRGVV